VQAVISSAARDAQTIAEFRQAVTERTWSGGLVENTIGVPVVAFKTGQHALRSVTLSAVLLVWLLLPAQAEDAINRAALNGLIAKHASAHGIPESLVHHVVEHESKYDPIALHNGSFGLMQISYGTARGMGYSGSAAGLLDADTNLTYGVLYLAKAYRAARGNEVRALRLYKSGF
jgi:soluble lytic murein transglycosylase-like protein